MWFEGKYNRLIHLLSSAKEQKSWQRVGKKPNSYVLIITLLKQKYFGSLVTKFWVFKTINKKANHIHQVKDITNTEGRSVKELLFQSHTVMTSVLGILCPETNK